MLHPLDEIAPVVCKSAGEILSVRPLMSYGRSDIFDHLKIGLSGTRGALFYVV